MADLSASENVWTDRASYDEMELVYQTHLQKLRNGGQSDFKPFAVNTEGEKNASDKSQVEGGLKTSIANEIAKAREHIRHTLDKFETNNPDKAKSGETASYLDAVMKKLSLIESQAETLTKRVETLESLLKDHKPEAKVEEVAEKVEVEEVKVEEEKKEDEEDFELFGSEDEEEDEEAERVKQARLKAYEEKKSKKPQLVAKSNIILDVKPWDDETDMAELEKCVRSIEMDGLLWGSSKLMPLAYGIKKLQISCVVEDDKVSTEDLEEKIVAFEDYVQSMDIAAFNKV